MINIFVTSVYSNRRSNLMKMKTAILVVIMILTMQACNAGTVTSTTSSPETVTATAQPQNIQMTPEVSTAVGNSDAVPCPPFLKRPRRLSPGDNPFPTNDAITMEDNGKIFTMHVGDSVLLNLGIDTYDWMSPSTTQIYPAHEDRRDGNSRRTGNLRGAGSRCDNHHRFRQSALFANADQPVRCLRYSSV